MRFYEEEPAPAVAITRSPIVVPQIRDMPAVCIDNDLDIAPGSFSIERSICSASQRLRAARILHGIPNSKWSFCELPIVLYTTFASVNKTFCSPDYSAIYTDIAARLYCFAS